MLKPKHKILVKFNFHYLTLYDSTLWTFALLRILKIHDAWKELEKMQKMSWIWAFYLKPFKNGGLLKSRYEKLQIASHKKLFGFYIFLDKSFSNCCNLYQTIGKDPGWLHFFCLIKLFPDLAILLKFHSQGALQHQS
jgi:hypothetical protein